MIPYEKYLELKAADKRKINTRHFMETVKQSFRLAAISALLQKESIDDTHNRIFFFFFSRKTDCSLEEYNKIATFIHLQLLLLLS